MQDIEREQQRLACVSSSLQRHHQNIEQCERGLRSETGAFLRNSYQKGIERSQRAVVRMVRLMVPKKER